MEVREKMKFKRNLALWLSLMLAFTMVAPTSIFAAGSGLVAGKSKAKIVLEYMEYDGFTINRENDYDANGGLIMKGMMSNKPIVKPVLSPVVTPSASPAASPDSDTRLFQKDDYMMLGIKLTDMENITEASDGLYAVKVLLQYDPSYLEPEDINQIASRWQYRLGMQSTSNLQKQNFTATITEPASDVTATPGWKILSIGLTIPMSNTPTYKGNSDEYLMFIEFKVKEASATKNKVFSMLKESQTSTISFGQGGTAGSYELAGSSPTIVDVIDYDDSVAEKITIKGTSQADGIVAKLDTGKNLTYKNAENLRTSDFVIKGHGTDGSEIDLTDASSVKFYRSTTAGTVAADGVSKTTAPADMSSYTEITNSTDSDNETAAWSKGVVKNDTLGNHLYVVADGYIAYLGELTVQDASISSLSGASLTDGFTTKVIGVDNISFSGGQVTATYDNGKSKVLQLADFDDNNLSVYRKTAGEGGAADTYEAIPATGSTVKFAASNAIVIATKDATDKKEVSVKTIAGTAVTTTYEIKTQPKTAYTYPETLSIANLEVTVTSSDPSIAGDKDLAAAKTAGIFDTVKIGTDTITMNADGTSARKITKADAGKTIDFYKGSDKVLSSNAITFTPKTVNLTATSDLVKEYDGTTATSGTGVNVKSGSIKYSVSGLETGDSAPADGKITGITAAYTSADASDSGIALTFSGTAAVNADQTDFNNKYTIGTTMPTGVTAQIDKKALTNLTFTITVSQNPSQSGDYTIPDGNFELTAANGKVGEDDVKIVHTGGTITEANMKNGVTDAAVNDITANTLDGTAKGNYSLGAVTVKATVSNLPKISALDSTTLTKITNATKNGTNNWKASDNKDLDALKALLPTTGTATDDKGNSHNVAIEWSIDPAGTTLNPQGGSYTFKANVTSTDDVIIETAANPTATIVVDAVTITSPTFSDVKASYTTGETAETLPATVQVSDSNGTKHTVNVTWSPATVDTSADNSPSGTDYTATVDYSSLPAWATLPATANATTKKETVTKNIVVSDVPLDPVSFNGTVAPVTAKANDAKNISTAELAKLLPEKLEVAKGDGTKYQVPVTWATETAYNAKGAEYTYKATLDDTFLTTNHLDASGIADITAKLTVTPIHVQPIGTTYGSITIRQGTDPTTGIKFIKSGDTTDDPDVKADFTIDWTPAASALDTATVGNSQVFTGTVKIDETKYPWLSYPVDKDGNEKKSDTLTVTVVKKGGGGGGGTSSYTVKFNAGSHGKVTEGKTSVSIVSGKKVETKSLPTVTPDEGYKFLGWSIDGKTVIDPTSDAVKKAVSYTALYEKIEDVEPTAKPTDEPLINEQYTKPYASGYDDGMFLPNDYITRAELSAMIARLINGDDIPDSYKATFPDVDDTWYNKYIGYLEDKNVLSGYEDGTFKPNQTVTRGEMCAIIARAQRYDLISIDAMFTDVTSADWAKDYITTLASKNIVSGYEDGTFGTYSPITRAETVVIINRVLDPSTPIVTFTPLDIAGHWAEADIMLAVNERKINDAAAPEVTPEATPEATPETTPEVTPEVTPEATATPTVTPAA